MYEMRQKQRKEMQQKRWFSYALLATAIFLFSQGSATIKTSTEYALPVILISFVLHIKSVGNLTERIFKIKSNIIAHIVMITALSVISIICYFNSIAFFYVFLLNIAAIAIYVITASICSKFKMGEK